VDYIKACSAYQHELSQRFFLITRIYYKLVTAVNGQCMHLLSACDKASKLHLEKQESNFNLFVQFYSYFSAELHVVLLPKATCGCALWYYEIKRFIVNPCWRSAVGKALRKVERFCML